MAKLGTLIVELATNSAKFVKGINATNKRLDNFAKTSRRVAQVAGAAFAGIQLGGLAKDLVDVVDKYKLLEGRLKLVQREGESLAVTQQKLFDLANRTRGGVGETTDFYVQLARATRSLGTDQETLLRTTEAINKAIIISGASAQSANAALFQLQQGLASGTLRGQELNSVLEQTPRVAEAIAEGLGVTIGQLRKLGEEGKLTAEAVIGAITSQADALDKEFSGVPVTVAQNMQLLTNEFENAAKGAGGLNKVLNASIDSLIFWTKAYNAAFNPTVTQEAEKLREKVAAINKELVGKSRGRISPARRDALEDEREIIIGQLDAINKRIDAEKILDILAKERANQQKKSNVVPINPAAEQSQADSAFGQEQGFSYAKQLEADAEAQAALLEQDREWRLARVRQATQEKEALEQLEKNKNAILVDSAASLFGNLAAIIGQGSKKQFELSKKLARAEVLISTYAAAQKAYEWGTKFGGPAAGAAAAAVAISAGLARLAAINRTSFGSATSAAANTGAGAFTATPDQSPITPQTNAAQGQTFIIISGSGEQPLSASQLDTLMENISQRVNEGSQVIIRRDSVQAQEIAAAVA